MKITSLSLTLLLSVASAFDCTPSAFQDVLPAGSKVAYTRSLPADSTFEVPLSNNPVYRASLKHLRALCAVEVNVTSFAHSAFSFGLFLPEDWNNRFLAVGNGGFAGGINWLDMGAGVGYGFATMSTDTGHNSSFGDISWAYQQPEKRTDFCWRAVHQSAVLAKQIIAAYYGQEAQFSYFSGCSTGGRQGLKALQMFPEDFDGVLAGAPAWWTKRLQTWTIKAGLDNLPVEADHHIPKKLFELTGKELLRQCDKQDGLEDNIMMDPRKCEYDLHALLCPLDMADQGAGTCLTLPQINTLRRIYTDYTRSDGGLIFPRLEPGSEAEWPLLLGGPHPATLGYEYPQYFLDLGSKWDYNDFNYSIVQLAEATDPGNCSATDYDLSPFQARGGKLLMYHGWSDGLIPTGSSSYFYNAVLQTTGVKGIDLDDFFRLFLVPGMAHCVGTPSIMDAPWYFAGANQAGALGSVHSVPGFEDARHDVLLALMEWVENGTAPVVIVATKWDNDAVQGSVKRQRPICPYPTQAIFDGVGDPDVAESWRCEHDLDLNVQF